LACSGTRANCNAILDAVPLRRAVKATFFTLGWAAVASSRDDAAHRRSRATRSRATAGITSVCSTLGEAAFAEDIARAQGVLEQTSGTAVTG